MVDSKNLALSRLWLALLLKGFGYAHQNLHGPGRFDPEGMFTLVRQLGSQGGLRHQKPQCEDGSWIKSPVLGQWLF